MLKRIITGIVLLAIIFGLIVLRGWYLRCALLFMALVAMHEVYGAFAHKGIKGVRWTGYVYVISEFVGEAFGGDLPVSQDGISFLALILCAMAAISCVVLKGKPDFEAMAASVVPMVYPGMFFACFMRIQSLDHPGIVTLALFMTIIMSAMNDTFALFVGKALGKRKLIPAISPNKTVEGSIGGLIASVIFSMAIPAVFLKVNAAWAIWPDMPEIAPIWAFAIFGLIAGAISQIGDLTASLLKRWCGIKDYGKIFPGHGGMMDRLDAILFSAAACYVFFMLMGHGIGE